MKRQATLPPIFMETAMAQPQYSSILAGTTVQKQADEMAGANIPEVRPAPQGLGGRLAGLTQAATSPPAATPLAGGAGRRAAATNGGTPPASLSPASPPTIAAARPVARRSGYPAAIKGGWGSRLGKGGLMLGGGMLTMALLNKLFPQKQAFASPAFYYPVGPAGLLAAGYAEKMAVTGRPGGMRALELAKSKATRSAGPDKITSTNRSAAGRPRAKAEKADGGPVAPKVDVGKDPAAESPGRALIKSPAGPGDEAGHAITSTPPVLVAGPSKAMSPYQPVLTAGARHPRAAEMEGQYRRWQRGDSPASSPLVTPAGSSPGADPVKIKVLSATPNSSSKPARSPGPAGAPAGSGPAASASAPAPASSAAPAPPTSGPAAAPQAGYSWRELATLAGLPVAGAGGMMLGAHGMRQQSVPGSAATPSNGTTGGSAVAAPPASPPAVPPPEPEAEAGPAQISLKSGPGIDWKRMAVPASVAALAAGGLGLGVYADRRRKQRAKEAFDLGTVGTALQNHWQSMTPAARYATIGGLGTLGYSLFNQATGVGPDVGAIGPLLGGGLAAAGLASPMLGLKNQPGAAAAPPAVGKAPPPAAAGGLTLQQAAAHPQFKKFFVNGQPNIQALVGAPDHELKGALQQLHPHARNMLKQQLMSFQPSAMQRMGARLSGIDIDQQRQRFASLLN